MEGRDEAVELRIHGIGGGEATTLLDAGPGERFGGDGLAGFFRSRPASHTRTLPRTEREVFVWGNLNSGEVTRAFWLLLLPIMLVNLAYWMRPRRLGGAPSPGHRMANRGYDIVVRAHALGLTVLLTLAAVGIGMDLVGWQCVAQGATCAELRPWLGFLASPGSPLSTTGTGLVLGSLVPVLLVVVLWRLSRRSGARYEAAVPDGPRQSTGDDEPISRRTAPLSHPLFWAGRGLFGRLRSAHIGSAMSTIAAVLLLPPLRYDHGVLAIVGWTLLAVTLLTGALCVLAACRADPGPIGERRAAQIAARVRLISVLLLLLACVYTIWPRPAWQGEGELPGFAAVLHWVLIVQILLCMVLFVLAFVLHRGNEERSHVAMLGLGGPTTVVLGVVLGGVFTAAVGSQAAQWLSGCPSSGAPSRDCLSFGVPAAYSWFQLAFTIVVAMSVVGVVALWVVSRRRTRRTRRDIAAEYGYATRRWPARDESIARARALASLTELAPWVVLPLMVPLFVLGAMGSTAALRSQPFGAGLHGTAAQFVDLVLTVGSVLGAVFLAVLVWLGRSALRDRPTREVVGMLWDIGSFWPRAAHPLAPPCYAERAVPQLVSRTVSLTDLGLGVVLSGHSQGSVLAAATVWQLPERCLERVALLTHGSPIFRLYARYFPAYFGPRALRELHGRAAMWRNLWRTTDPIAGPVHLDASPHGATVLPERPMPDPRYYHRRPGEAVADPLKTHFWYTRDEDYPRALRETVAAVRDADGPTAYQGP